MHLYLKGIVSIQRMICNFFFTYVPLHSTHTHFTVPQSFIRTFSVLTVPFISSIAYPPNLGFHLVPNDSAKFTVDIDNMIYWFNNIHKIRKGIELDSYAIGWFVRNLTALSFVVIRSNEMGFFAIWRRYISRLHVNKYCGKSFGVSAIINIDLVNVANGIPVRIFELE